MIEDIPEIAKLDDMVGYLNELFAVDSTPDYSMAYNGLQLANTGQVAKIAVAVDSTEPVIQKAADFGADLLIVHHGMFWQGVRMLVGADYRKLKLAMDQNMAVYSVHIPLDIHPEYGNNILLAKSLGLLNAVPFGDWKGVSIGFKEQRGDLLDEFLIKVEDAVGQKVLCARGRKSSDVGVVGVITGSAGSEIERVAKEGVDTLVTGEGPHWSHGLAEELGVNLIYAGHYATETFGVKAIGRILEEKYPVECVFIDHPSGL